MTTTLENQHQQAQELGLNPETSAVMFLIHGTRNPKAVEAIHQEMAVLCKNYADTIGFNSEWVQYSFLEFLDPSLESGLEKLYLEGRKDLVIVPLLLFPGTHLYQDIPEVADTLTTKYPDIRIRAGAHLGVLEPEFAGILSKRIKASR